jgi:signal transduction histidine kinase/CheY-like chemotaxis protein
LVGLRSVEHELGEPLNGPVIRPLIEMRRALWVPVSTHGLLRGILLAGARKKKSKLPRALLESVSAEFSLIMELEDERRFCRETREDLRSVRSALASLASLGSVTGILNDIVNDCMQQESGPSGPGAVFAAVGRVCNSPGTRIETGMAEVDLTRIAWQSGERSWMRALESEPLCAVWRQALESHRVAGAEVASALPHSEVDRVLAFPLEASGETLGVLVAGLRRSSESLSLVERLQLRSALATSALLRQKQSEMAAERELRHKEAIIALVKTRPEPSAQTKTDQDFTEIMNVIEWLEEGVVLFGARQEIRALNTRFGQIIGLAPAELASIRTRDDLVASIGARTADTGSFAERWRKSDVTLGAVREELHLIRPVPRLLERAARPILDKKGALIGRVEIYRDVTAQRVFQSKLLQTEKLAELGQMVTGIAHELSNPLTSILGYAQRLLLRHDRYGDSHEARPIFQEAERASAILRQLLLSARDSRPERSRVALNQVVSRTLELQRFSSGADNIRVELDLEPVLPFVLGDAGQLQQVLMNLIGNARQAIEEQGKGGTIRVKTQRVAEKRVLLEVSDDGPGIPQGIQARIFDPFFTTKPAGVGTGLGLAIVLGIVREHGGKLHLASNLGKGTVFSIELPAIAAEAMPLPASGGARPARPCFQASPAAGLLESAHAGGALSAWAGTRVLVLEDEPTVARLIADVLEDEGLRVDVLLDAREALDRTARENYALAICDMKMPELDGEHFYQALVSAKTSLCERFLFVTGDVLAAHTRNFLERNHLPHVAKPFRVEELTAKIRGVLEATSPRELSRAPVAKRNAARK